MKQLFIKKNHGDSHRALDVFFRLIASFVFSGAFSFLLPFWCLTSVCHLLHDMSHATSGGPCVLNGKCCKLEFDQEWNVGHDCVLLVRTCSAWVHRASPSQCSTASAASKTTSRLTIQLPSRSCCAPNMFEPCVQAVDKAVRVPRSDSTKGGDHGGGQTVKCSRLMLRTVDPCVLVEVEGVKRPCPSGSNCYFFRKYKAWSGMRLNLPVSKCNLGSLRDAAVNVGVVRKTASIDSSKFSVLFILMSRHVYSVLSSSSRH